MTRNSAVRVSLKKLDEVAVLDNSHVCLNCDVRRPDVDDKILIVMMFGMLVLDLLRGRK